MPTLTESFQVEMLVKIVLNPHICLTYNMLPNIYVLDISEFSPFYSLSDDEYAGLISENPIRFETLF